MCGPKAQKKVLYGPRARKIVLDPSLRILQFNLVKKSLNYSPIFLDSYFNLHTTTSKLHNLPQI